MKLAHVRVIYPPGTQRGVARVTRGARIEVTIDGQEPFELNGVRGVGLEARFDEPDLIKLELLGTVEVTYE